MFVLDSSLSLARNAKENSSDMITLPKDQTVTPTSLGYLHSIFNKNEQNEKQDNNFDLVLTSPRARIAATNKKYKRHAPQFDGKSEIQKYFNELGTFILISSQILK